MAITAFASLRSACALAGPSAADQESAGTEMASNECPSDRGRGAHPHARVPLLRQSLERSGPRDQRVGGLPFAPLVPFYQDITLPAQCELIFLELALVSSAASSHPILPCPARRRRVRRTRGSACGAKDAHTSRRSFLPCPRPERAPLLPCLQRSGCPLGSA
jgi:hypothetical protein